MAFDVPRKGRTCACCGITIITKGTDNAEYVRLHFTLQNTTAVAPVSFCQSCASQPWTDDRIAALDAQCQWMHAQAGNPKFEMPHLTGVDPTYPPQTWAEIGPLKVAL